MNKHQVGTVSEILAQSYFVRKKYIVSKPINDFNEYDLVVDKGVLQRIQVKTIYWDNSKKRHLISCVTSHTRGNARRLNKKYSDNSFDFLCGIEQKTKAIYIIPIKNILGRRSVTLYPEGKPNSVSKRYKDYEQYRVE